MDLGNRKWAIKSLVGSHNYNLNDKDSDNDFKLFVLPTFDDLYCNKMFSTSQIGEHEDYDVHDIRKLTNLLFKSNINFVEVLFSNEIEINLDLNESLVLMHLLDKKDSLARMNLPYLYNACIGMYFNKMKYLEKGTEGTMHLVEKFGYDTKQALHSYRVLDFLQRYLDNGFSDFKQAIEYDDKGREFMLGIKHGKYTKEEFIKMVEVKKEWIDKIKDSYSYEADEDLKYELECMVKDLVKANL